MYTLTAKARCACVRLSPRSFFCVDCQALLNETETSPSPRWYPLRPQFLPSLTVWQRRSGGYFAALCIRSGLLLSVERWYVSLRKLVVYL